jgi:8-hydroxy-5-deazaflavin:NADPH oxidoreductase
VGWHHYLDLRRFQRRRIRKREMGVRFGVLGTGVVGKPIAAGLASLGHEVMVGTGDSEETLSRTEPDRYGNPPFGAWQEEHPEVRLGTFAEAAAQGETVLNATPSAVSREALEQAGEENLSGKVLIDISNPLDLSKGMPPTLLVSNTDSLGEQIQWEAREAKRERDMQRRKDKGPPAA